jgi:hypothetical protein
VLAALIFFCEVYVLLPDSSGRSARSLQAAYERIQEGMSREEVEQLLGADHGFIPEGHAMTAPDIGPRPGSYGSTWFGNDMVVEVWFGEMNHRVTAKENRRVIALPSDTFYAKVRRFLRL